MKKFVSITLALGLGLFLADAVLSFLDDTFSLFLEIHALSAIRGIVAVLAVIALILIYLLMGITPMIPKRFFLPVTLFIPGVLLGMIPLSIYHSDLLPQIAWLFSLGQVFVGVGILAWLQGGLRFRWPVIPEQWLGDRSFGWWNFFGFILANVFGLLPAVFVYLAWCGAMAVDHFSGGFLALRSDRLTVRARQYVRDDGKKVHLIPMMHIGEPGFYRQVMKSFPTNSVILLEGVTDQKNLLKQRLSYQRVAAALGLSEQQDQFSPAQGRARRADVDVEQFSEKSIGYLNLIAILYSQGLTADVLRELIEKSQDPLLAKQLWDDILTRRNEHLVKEIQAELLRSETIVVPWGAIHIPGIAKEIQRSGFQPAETQEHDILHFRTVWSGLRSR